MPTKSSSTSKRPKKPVVRPATSRFQRLRQGSKFKFVLILLFALVGSYLIAFGAAAPNSEDGVLEPDNPARGLYYQGHKVLSSGTCKGALRSDGKDTTGKDICGHPDPGPVGVDVRERDKHVDSDLAAMVKHDKEQPAKTAESTDVAPETTIVGASDVGSANSLGSVTPVNWPCIGSGSDGARVQVLYLYAGGQPNRISTVRPDIESIAKRTNAVFHNSGSVTGGIRNVRFVTSSSCALSIIAVPITEDINNTSNIIRQLTGRGYSRTDRKYLLEIDGGTSCGYGNFSTDSRPTADNPSNGGPNYAFVWHPCWNYGEPHELMHTFGAVLAGAPYSTTRNHCTDQHDVMCYNDGSGQAMIQRCTNSTQIWRFDCGADTYFKAAGAGGWLSTHWNTANSVFLSH